MEKRLILVSAVLMGVLLLSASIVWAQPAPVAKTGQTYAYGYGDDGYYEKGVASPSPRFTDNGDGTVTDNLTGLMWAKNANMDGQKDWYDAIPYANNLSLGTACGTPRTDWRLPNRFELESLLDLGNNSPALPTGHLFTNVQSYYYWSSTTNADDTASAWNVSMGSGYLGYPSKAGYYYVWPVRGGN